VLNRLTTRWDYIRGLYENGALGEDTNNDAQEVLEDILNRTLTREYLDVLKVALVGGSANVQQETGGDDVMMDHDELSMDGVPHMTRAAQSAMQSDIISDIGKKLLAAPSTCSALVTVIFK
jgi:exportin-5